MAFDENVYCDFTGTSAKGIAGKDVLLCIFDATGAKLLAIAGQQGLTINRSADSIDTTTKDTVGGWKSSSPGMKEWSIDTDGLYVKSDDSHKALAKAFDEGNPICLKVVNTKDKSAMFGGLGSITDYSLEAPFDDSMTYSISIAGMGALVDLSDATAPAMPGEPATIKK